MAIIKSEVSLFGKGESIKAYTGVPYKVYNSVPVVLYGKGESIKAYTGVPYKVYNSVPVVLYKPFRTTGCTERD
jgi:hypothetical protein